MFEIKDLIEALEAHNGKDSLFMICNYLGLKNSMPFENEHKVEVQKVMVNNPETFAYDESDKKWYLVKNDSKNTNIINSHTELANVISLELFTNHYKEFMSQADRNTASKLGEGDKKSITIDGQTYSRNYGIGAASKHPYISWSCVSVYYNVDEKTISIGIEYNRYKHIKEMKNYYIENFSVNRPVAIFYKISKDKIDFVDLYNRFISISEEVLKLGTD